MKRMWLSLGVALFVAAVVVAYGVGRAGASGIPQSNTLAFSGTLLTFGQPDNSTHSIGLTLYLSNGTATTCVVTPSSIQVSNGQFTVPLPQSCVTIIHQNAGLQVQVTIDNTPMGMTSISAVPYAVEAETASNVAAGSPLSLTMANFVDLSSNQSVGGVKNFTQNLGFGNTSPAFSIDGSAKTDAFALPVGTTSQRPTPANGAIRFNTDFGGYEIYTNGFWFRQDPFLLSDSGRTRVVAGYTGSNQSFSVPTGVTRIFAKVWGAGGAGGTIGGWNFGAAGGGGGYSRGIIPVISGESLIIVVGQGGLVDQATGYGYGGGASGAQNNSNNQYGSGGGGYSGIFRGSTPLLIAGGGGGGGSSRYAEGNTGGAGGGVTGAKGESPYAEAYTGGGGLGANSGTINGPAQYSYGGNPGTQTAGGAAAPAGSCSFGGTAGTQYQGGHGGCNSYGGGGGGGYYGGAGGGYLEPNTMAGGGGGSGFIGSTVLFGVTLTGDERSPGMSSDPDLPKAGDTYTLAAHGGASSGYGGNGYIVIYY